MNRSEMHFGQKLYLKTLYETDDQYGSEKELRELIGSYVTIYEFCYHDPYAVRIKHPLSGYEYSIRVEDLRKTGPKFDGSNDAKKSVRLSYKKKPVTFDVKRLFV